MTFEDFIIAALAKKKLRHKSWDNDQYIRFLEDEKKFVNQNGVKFPIGETTDFTGFKIAKTTVGMLKHGDRFLLPEVGNEYIKIDLVTDGWNSYNCLLLGSTIVARFQPAHREIDEI